MNLNSLYQCIRYSTNTHILYNGYHSKFKFLFYLFYFYHLCYRSSFFSSSSCHHCHSSTSFLSHWINCTMTISINDHVQSLDSSWVCVLNTHTLQCRSLHYETRSVVKLEFKKFRIYWQRLNGRLYALENLMEHFEECEILSLMF